MSGFAGQESALCGAELLRLLLLELLEVGRDRSQAERYTAKATTFLASISSAFVVLYRSAPVQN